MIQPNYAVKALVPIPVDITNTVTEVGFLKKADLFITDCYKIRRRTYRFLILCFCLFSAIGIYYYFGFANGQTPISLYIPVNNLGEITFTSIYMFRRLHIFVSLFLMLSGFTVFGFPTSLLFIVSDSFVIGFSLRYSLTYLTDNKSLGFVLLYFFCISLFAILDVLLCCEVIKYSSFAKGGTKEMFGIRRFAGYISSYLIIIALNVLNTYLFILVSK